ncbi:MAG: 4'-phosphopantetheinyl transferase [Ornithinibacter sp.]
MGRVRAVRRASTSQIALAATQGRVGADVLLSPELELVEGAGEARLAEFAGGRHCAHLAMASLDPRLGGMPVLRDRRGAPEWPSGVVGSITHCAGWTGAVAARARGSRFGRGVAGIGLDAERIGPLPAGVAEVVASVAEREALARLGAQQPGIPWDTLLFSAKEATYKAWYPLTGIVLSHAQVAVELSPGGRFTGHPAAHDPGGREVVHRVRGRWTLGPEVLVALGVVP